MSGGLKVTLGQYSGAGRKNENQDFHGALIPDGRALALKGVTLAVADGISSSAVSRIAAESAVKAFLTDYYCTSDAWSVKTAGSRVIAATNSWLFAETRRSRDVHDMDSGYVCTFDVLVVKGRQAHLFHIGDGRIWRHAGDTLEQLTDDHRIVLSSQENYLGRALGMAQNIEIDYRTLDLAEGETLLLTTDGIHGHVSPRDMARIIAAEADPDRAAQAVAALALGNGSADNLTIQILRVESLPEPDAAGFMERADLLPPPPLPDVPSEFEGYRLLRNIHANARSHIYLAEDMETGQRVALKIPSIDMRGDAHYLRRFVMEEWIARRLSSPHVLKAAPPHAGRRHLYVVTDYVEGQTLRQWMTDNPAPDLEAVRDIVEQIARGLRAFHRMEMLHQDLRPENIMIDRQGTVKIIDFGSTRVAGVTEAAPRLETGDILGTVQYTAPEYFLGAAGTEQSDLFSLGVIAYEMLTGRLPYGAAVSRATTRKAQDALRYAPASTARRAVPDWVDAALARAVHPRPAERYEELSEFTTDLRRPHPRFVSRRSPPLAERNPLRFWQILSLLLAVALILALGR